MCTSEIVYYPDVTLRVVARNVTDVSDPHVVQVIENLTATMASFEHCVGLAANQIGSDLNIFVADASKNDRAESQFGFIVLINPVYVEKSGTLTKREGCMSVPDQTGNVARAERVTISGLDIYGNPVTLSANDFEARVFQHEIDHLAGKIFLDRVTSARDVFTRKTYRPADGGPSQ